jgi:hypothetical protein
LTPAPLKVTLRYLVTSSGPEPSRASARLAELLFAAMTRDGIEVESEGLSAEEWIALGIPARPGFVMGVPLRREREAVIAPPVRQPPEIHEAPMRVLRGVLIGVMEDVEAPLSDARVVVPGLGQSARSDAAGRFRLTGLPSDPAVRDLVVSAKGRTRRISLDQAPQEDGVHVIRFNVLEE